MRYEYNIKEVKVPSLLTIDSIKQALRINHKDDDQYLLELYYSGLEYIENFTGLSVFERHIELTINNYQRPIYLKYIPIVKFNSIKQIEKEGDKEEELKIINFNSSSNKLALTADSLHKNFKILYVSGYKDLFPSTIKTACRMVIEELYDRGIVDMEVEKEIFRLLSSQRKIKV